MSLNFKNHEAAALARQLPAATGESLTRAVTVAVRGLLMQVRGEKEVVAAERADRLRDHQRRCRAMGRAMSQCRPR